MTTAEPIFLLAEDDRLAAMLMQTVFERAGFRQPLQFAHDGEAAIDYLRGEGVHADRAKYPLPTVVLLDLNMPRKNGFEVLAWIRAEPALKLLPVFVLSASSNPDDIQRAYESGANSYLVKPGNLDELMLLANTLLAWGRLCHFAPGCDLAGQAGPPALASRDRVLNRAG